MNFVTYLKNFKKSLEKVNETPLKIDKTHFGADAITAMEHYGNYIIFRETRNLVVATWVLAIGTIILVFLSN